MRAIILLSSCLLLGTYCNTPEKPQPTTPPPAPTYPTPPVPDATPPIPPTEDAGLTLEQACIAACDRWKQWGCREGRDVCTRFDDEGVCRWYAPCKDACVEDTHAYPDPHCVVALPEESSCEQSLEDCI